ncbi:MAG: serine hydrolase [Myxococcales bacterium]|nr:serine hydrolase [Myxococcales bacterium]
MRTTFTTAFVLLTALTASTFGPGCTEPESSPGASAPDDDVPPAPDAGPPYSGGPSPDQIPAQGTMHAGLEELDDVIKKFMRATCTGSVVFALGFGGKPLVSRGYGYREGPPNKKCAADTDPFIGANKMKPDAAFRIGSNSKAFTAAIVRIVLKQKLAALGRPTTDQEVESLKVFDPALDLVPARLRNAVLVGSTTAAPNCIQPPVGGSKVTMRGTPDPRLRDITVGQLLGHISGLPQGGNPVTNKLAAIRGIDSVQELDAEAGTLGVSSEKQVELAEKHDGGHFIRQENLEEYLLANADLCLEFEPGKRPAGANGYSNIGYGYLQAIAEHVSGRTLHAPLGLPEKHPESLMAQFLSTRLGITKGADSAYGVYLSQTIPALRDSSEPVYRAWDGQSLNGRFRDVKRPWCIWSEDEKKCDASQFLAGKSRYNWSFVDTKVAVGDRDDGYSGGPGLFAAEMPILLEFMAKYWVNGDGATPFYGRERSTNPSPDQIREHRGALAGTHSTITSFTGATVNHNVVPTKPDGEFDLVAYKKQLDENNATTSQCKLPAGIDMAFAANQVNDATCPADICNAYGGLREALKEKLCTIDWLKVSPQISSND